MTVDPHLDAETGYCGIASGLSNRWCCDGRRRTKLTHYFAEVNVIHPFREGNGRAQRAYFRQLAREAGWLIDWSILDPEENIQVSMASLCGEVPYRLGKSPSEGSRIRVAPRRVSGHIRAPPGSLRIAMLPVR